MGHTWATFAAVDVDTTSAGASSADSFSDWLGLALVIVTAVYALLTWSTAKAAKASAASAARSAAAAERSLMLESMPVVIGMAKGRIVDNDRSTACELRNLSPATAFNITAAVWQPATHRLGGLPGPVSMLPGQSTREKLPFEPRFVVDGKEPYVIEATYSDVLGNDYRTRRTDRRGHSTTDLSRWDPESGAWVVLVSAGEIIPPS